MFKALKYLKLIGLFQNSKKAYKEHTGKDRPAFLSRRFMGAIVLLVGTALSIHLGVKIDSNIFANIADSADKMVGAGIVLYGAIMEIVGIVKRERKE